jgi:hypothetical protein
VELEHRNVNPLPRRSPKTTSTINNLAPTLFAIINNEAKILRYG